MLGNRCRGTERRGRPPGPHAAPSTPLPGRPAAPSRVRKETLMTTALPEDARAAADNPCDPDPPSAHLLVVDDAPVECRLAAGLVEKALGWRVTSAHDGPAALAAIAADRP